MERKGRGAFFAVTALVLSCRMRSDPVAVEKRRQNQSLAGAVAQL
jgi:hypothetical protein